jgi:hypothetical protein
MILNGSAQDLLKLGKKKKKKKQSPQKIRDMLNVIKE